MVFNSLTFIVFFCVVLLLHNLPLPWGVKKFNLLVASYLFYAAWNPPFILLLWASTVVDWLVARQIHRQEDHARRKAWLIVSLVVNLGFLGFFKYGNFALENWHSLMNAVGVHYRQPEWNILLPVGISFYTFHSMSYTLDIYWRRVEPIPKLFDFALFVAFFTQLVAGPILRTSDLVPQFARPRTATRNQLCWGLALMTFGLFEKVVLADGAFAPVADAVFKAKGPVSSLDAWLGTLAFSGRSFVILPDTPLSLSDLPFVSASTSPITSVSLMPPQDSQISGGDGISLFPPGCGTIFIYLSAVIAKAKPGHTST